MVGKNDIQLKLFSHVGIVAYKICILFFCHFNNKKNKKNSYTLITIKQLLRTIKRSDTVQFIL